MVESLASRQQASHIISKSEARHPDPELKAQLRRLLEAIEAKRKYDQWRARLHAAWNEAKKAKRRAKKAKKMILYS